MADKVIGELPAISSLDAGSLFVAEQNGQAVKVSGKQLTDFSNVETAAQVEQAKASAQAAQAAKESAEAAILKNPIIQNGTWWVYNQTAGAYQDTGINATGPQGETGPTSSVNGISPDASGNITLTAGNVGAAPVYQSDVRYPADAQVVWKGNVWRNTSGQSVTGVEPGTDYNKWNVGYSNPNLLDNPWFTVNQRGQTSYTGEGYTVDRWKATYSGDGTTRVLSDGGIGINRPAAHNAYAHQILDDELSKYLAGKVVTLSFKVDTYADFAINATINGSSTPIARCITETAGIYATSVTVPLNTTSIRISCQNRSTIETIIRAVKLELGSVSTLANDSPPDYATELAKCQRYFWRSWTGERNGHNSILGVVFGDNIRITGFDYPVEMRTKPSITVYGLTGEDEVSEWVSDDDYGPVVPRYWDTQRCVALGCDGAGLSNGDRVFYFIEANAEL